MFNGIIYNSFVLITLLLISALFVEIMLNNTIEERVTLLEIQVTDIREDLTTTEENVSDLDEDVNFLFDETVLQDERLFSLEQDNDVINQELESQFLNKFFGYHS